MPCAICGEKRTVRSHIIPKALIHDIREGSSHVVKGSRWHRGAKPSQGGEFSDYILCAEHEGITARLDKYGVEFIRRAEAAFQALRPRDSFAVANPQPSELQRFVLSVIWREVVANGRRTLGPYRQPVIDAVFGGSTMPWPLLVSRTWFTAGSREAVKLGVHPYTIRIFDRNAWTMTLAGFSFYSISDRRGLPILVDWMRADLADPVVLTVGHPQELAKVGVLQSIYRNMKNRVR